MITKDWKICFQYQKQLIISVAAHAAARLFLGDSKLAYCLDALNKALSVQLALEAILQLLNFNITSAVAQETLTKKFTLILYLVSTEEKFLNNSST